MKIQFIAIAALSMGIAWLNNAVAGDISLALEEPAANTSMTGIANIRGWAVSTAGIDRVELYMNGSYITDIPYGGTRGDVANQFPEYPDSRYSGFSMIWNYLMFSSGENKMSVTAYDDDGASKTVQHSFEVVKFHKPYFIEEAPVSFRKSTQLDYIDDVLLLNLGVLGKHYTVRMGWDKGKQNLTIKDTLPAAYSSSTQDGQWVAYGRPDVMYSNADSACNNLDMRLNLSRRDITGLVHDSAGSTYSFDGSVATNGVISGESSAFKAAFDGSLTGDFMAGTWADDNGCYGRWWGYKD